MRHDHFSMLPERAFRSLGGRMTLEGGGKGSAPAAPDYTGAAQAQAQSSAETTNMANYANRPTINTPFGGQNWQTEKVVDPGTGQEVTKWTQNTTLSPESQAALDSQMAMQQGRSDIANSLMPQAQEAITTPIDYDSFSQPGTAPTLSNFQSLGPAQAMQTSFQATQGMPGQFKAENLPAMPTFDKQFVGDMLNESLNYMRPDQERQQSALETKLVNQGLSRGSEAYENAYRQMMDQQSRDKYNALGTAFNQGNQMFNNQLSANNQSFNQQNQSWLNNFNLGNTSFNQAQALASFGNNARQQDFNNAQNQAQFNNTNLQNEFAQQQNLANYQNQQRQQQIAEAQQRQLQPLNNINALMTGQQVGMPQMPSFNANQAAQPVNYLGAAQAQGNYNMQAQQMNNASQSSTMGGIGSLLGTGMSAAMMFSDKRLKRDVKLIKMIGRGKKKFGWYRYRYVGQDTWYEGVLAHEVQKVFPEAVKRHHNGYNMVNYAAIGV